MKPYVWTFDPAGGEGKKRAPRNLFTEKDMYTILAPDGSRDLTIEHELSKLESGLKKLVADFIAQRRQPPQSQHLRLIDFIAAMHGRTPRAREIQRKLWQDALDADEQHRSDAATLSGSENARETEETSLRPSSKVRLDTLRRAVESPMQFLLPGAIVDGSPMLRQMTMIIMWTDEPSFITSDYPVTWHDQTVARDKFYEHKFSFSDEGLQVTMPLSPRHTIMLCHPMTPFLKPVSYIKACGSTVAGINRRTAFYADKAVVSWKDGFDPTWLIEASIR